MKTRIRKFKKADAKKVSDFIIKIFKEFNKKNCTKNGIKFFIETYKKENIQKKWLGDYIIIIEIKNRIIAVGRAKKDGWITHCYVDKKYMRKGIGNILMNKLENWIKLKRNKVFLNSSTFARKFYKNRGYQSSGAKRLYHGIPLYPMIKKLR